MGFYVYVWHEAAPTTADAAAAKLDRALAGERDVFVDHPAVPALREALLRRFPSLEELDEDAIDEQGVWNFTPVASDSVLEISVVWSRAGEVYPVVRQLAREHGLVCYEPGDRVLEPNAVGYVSRFTLTTQRLGEYRDPNGRRIEWAVSQLSNDNYFVALTRADGWYVQVGYGAPAGVAPGTYALEYQEGSTEQHFASHTTDISAATRFMKEFRAGKDVWKRRHGWRRLTL